MWSSLKTSGGVRKELVYADICSFPCTLKAPGYISSYKHNTPESQLNAGDTVDRGIVGKATIQEASCILAEDVAV